MNRLTARRIQHASGYMTLGLLKEARAELMAIEPGERELPEVTETWIDFAMSTKRWKTVLSRAVPFARRHPERHRAWIAWAYALRELGKIAEAKRVLLEAEPLHGNTSPTLHYNLGCYYCLLGDRAEARKRLAKAFAMHPEFATDALEDPDLVAMHDELRTK